MSSLRNANIDFWNQFIFDLNSTSEAIHVEEKINVTKLEIEEIDGIPGEFVNSAECMNEEFIDSSEEFIDDQNIRSEDGGDINGMTTSTIVTCSICYKSYADEERLVKHQKCAHLPTVNLMCSKCQKIFIYRKRLIEHYMKRHNNETFECDLCQKLFKFKRNLKLHMTNVHMKKKTVIIQRTCALVPYRWKCNFCSVPFLRSMRLLNIHYRDEHGADERLKLVCRFCNDLFETDNDISGHFSTEDTMIKCTICKQPFKCKTKLAIHQRQHDNSLMCQVSYISI